jgi:excisionase family DNA binding protein
MAAAVNPWMTPEEVAERFKVPLATVYAWRYKRIGPAAVKVGRHLRYRVEAVEAWERQREEEAAARAR